MQFIPNEKKTNSSVYSVVYWQQQQKKKHKKQIDQIILRNENYKKTKNTKTKISA